MSDRTKTTIGVVLAALIALAAVYGVGVQVGDNGTQTTTVKTPAPKVDIGPLFGADKDNQLDRPEQRQADDHARSEPDFHEDTRDETPPGVTKAERDHLQRAADLEARQLKPKKVGGAQGYSCPSHTVVNRSSLSSRRVGVALHFTVSNPGSILGIRNLFNSPSAGVSANYGYELFNLRCEHWVPDSQKAWAQGAFNSAYISIEIVSNDRSKASWLATPAIKGGSLAALVRDLLRKTGAPAKLVDPSGCTPKPGLTDHDRLECGNNHWDVGKNFPWREFLAQIRSGHVSSPTILTRDEVKMIRGAAIPKGTGHSRGYWCGRETKQIAAIRRAAHRAGGGGYKARHRGGREQLLRKSNAKRCR